MINFLCQIEILLLNILKLLKIQVFSRFFVQYPRFFKVFFSKFLKFKVFPGKVATLKNTETFTKI